MQQVKCNSCSKGKQSAVSVEETRINSGVQYENEEN